MKKSVTSQKEGWSIRNTEIVSKWQTKFRLMSLKGCVGEGGKSYLQEDVKKNKIRDDKVPVDRKETDIKSEKKNPNWTQCQSADV